MITKRSTRGLILPGGSTGGAAKRNRTPKPTLMDKVFPKPLARVDMDEFMPDDVKAARASLLAEPKRPKQPTVTVVAEEKPRVESVPAVEPEPDDEPMQEAESDETLLAVLEAARRNRKGFTGDDPELQPVPFGKAFDTVFGEWFGRKEADGSVIPRYDRQRYTLGEDTWWTWKVFGKSIFGEKLTRKEMEFFTAYTGRDYSPTMPVREVWAAISRRAGKNWTAAAIIVFVACMRKHGLRRGELGKVMLLAANREQAAESFRYIADLILSISAFKDMIIGGSADRTMSTIRLCNRVEIQVMVADKTSVRGRGAIFILCDEISHWQTKEGAVNLDKEILSALRPSKWGVKGAMILCISSPFARKGALYEASKEWGKPMVTRTRNGATTTVENPTLYWQAPTLAFRPSTDPDFLADLEADEASDPAAFKAEGLGQFRADLETYISIEAMEALMIAGRDTIGYEFGYPYFIFIDTAGGSGQDSATLCVARGFPVTDQKSGSQYRVAQVCLTREWRPKFSASIVAGEIADIAYSYKIRKIYGDNFSGATWQDIIKKAAPGITYEISKDTKSVLYRNALPLITSKRIELPDRAKNPITQRIIDQFVSLERTGDDKIDAAQKAPEDVANAVAGACLLAATKAIGGASVSSVTFSNGRIVNIINPGRAA